MAEEYAGTLSGIAGASTRSLQEKFKQARGYSPMAFAKEVRLKRARERLRLRQSGPLCEGLFQDIRRAAVGDARALVSPRLLVPPI
jgi:AraC-like DNA-binding protein